MKFDRLVVLVSSQTLEEFDLQRRGDEAEQVLSAWSSLWHPLLLASARVIPTWLPATTPPLDPAGHLIIIPDFCESALPDGWLAQAEATGACVLRRLRCREEMLAAALERLGGDRVEIDPDLAADFLALGYCHFQVELLTRKIRYTSNLDEAALQAAALSAVDAILLGDVATTRQHLQSAFDRLHDARNYSNAVDLHLLDLTLVASTTLGDSLRRELGGTLPRNVLLAGAIVEEMARREPETVEILKRSLAAGTAALIGGEYAEAPLPLMAPEAIGLDLCRGLAAYTEHLGQRPVVFGRRRFGLTPALPQILERLGFNAAYHCTLDDGRFPAGKQSRIQWEGADGTTIKAIGCLPVDAERTESFLRLAERLSDAVSLDSTATVMFAHWPGQVSPWYDDLRRIAAYGSVLGTFTTVTDYFEKTSLAGQRNHYKADEYRSPYLKQDVSSGRRDPISRWIRYFRRRAEIEATQALQMLTAACGVAGAKGEGGRVMGDHEGGGGLNEECAGGQLAIAIEDARDAGADEPTTLDDRLAGQLQGSLAEFGRSIVGRGAVAERGDLYVNPWSFAQPAPVSGTAPVDVPAMGFAWLRPDVETGPVPSERRGWFGRRKREEPPLAEENVLRNEFFEVWFDPHTGAIQSISDYHSRDPRLAQQIALRLPRGGAPGSDAEYSIMSADELTVTAAGPMVGEIVARGRLMDRQGRRVAGFRQTTRARRGSRVVEIQIELETDQLPDANPWDSYYAARFAWKDESAVLHRSVNMANLPTELTQIESPHYLDIRRDKQRTTVLCGGLPYHRRFGPRKLDTLLVVRGETARSFRLGVGIDVPHPMSAALGFIAPPLRLPDQLPPATPTGWLFHLDCRNVLATHWEPVLEGGDDASPEGHDLASRPTAPAAAIAGPPAKTAGFRVRLLETDGCGVRLGFRCFRPVRSARKLNPCDMPPVELTIEGDRIDIPIGPHQWTEVEVRFMSL